MRPIPPRHLVRNALSSALLLAPAVPAMAAPLTLDTITVQARAEERNPQVAQSAIATIANIAAQHGTNAEIAHTAISAIAAIVAAQEQLLRNEQMPIAAYAPPDTNLDLALAEEGDGYPEAYEDSAPGAARAQHDTPDPAPAQAGTTPSPGAILFAEPDHGPWHDDASDLAERGFDAPGLALAPSAPAAIPDRPASPAPPAARTSNTVPPAPATSPPPRASSGQASATRAQTASPARSAQAPRQTSRPAPAVAPSSPPSTTRTHTVQKGDTLYSIARRYGTTVQVLQQINRLPDNRIIVGRRLRLPAAAPVAMRPQAAARPRAAAGNKHPQAKPSQGVLASGSRARRAPDLPAVERDLWIAAHTAHEMPRTRSPLPDTLGGIDIPPQPAAPEPVPGLPPAPVRPETLSRSHLALREDELEPKSERNKARTTPAPAPNPRLRAALSAASDAGTAPPSDGALTLLASTTHIAAAPSTVGAGAGASPVGKTGGGMMISPMAFNPIPPPSTRYEVTDGTSNNVIPAGSTVKSDLGDTALQAAVRASGSGSTIGGHDLNIRGRLQGTSERGFGVVAQDGGQVNLTGDNTQVVAQSGLHVEGAGSRVSMDGGSIKSDLIAVNVFNQGEVSLQGVSVDITSAATSSAFNVGGNGGTLNIAGKGSTRSVITSKSAGILVNDGAGDVTLDIRDTDITTDSLASNIGDGIHLFSNNNSGTRSLALERVTIEVKGNNASGLKLFKGATTLADTNIVAHGIDTIGLGVYGIYVDAQNGAAGASADMTGGSVTVHGANAWAAGAARGGKLDMDGVTLEKTTAGNGVGVVFANGTMSLKNGTVNSAGALGFYVLSSDAELKIEDSTINLTADNSRALFTSQAAAALSNVRLKGSAPGGNRINATGKGSTMVHAQHAASVEIENTRVDASGEDNRGVWVQAQDIANIVGAPAGVGSLKVKSSDFSLTGNNSMGVLFQAGSTFGPTLNSGTPNPNYYADAESVNQVDISDGSIFTIDSGYGVVANGGVNTLNVSNSTISADRLAVAANLNRPDPANPSGPPLDTWGAKLDINASNGSALFGHTYVSDQSRLTMNLQSGSTWTLRPSTISTSTNGTRQSDVSILNLDNASIAFAAPAPSSDYQQDDIWQTLVVGSGTPGTSAVYNASGNAHITMNALLNAGGELSNQYTDRLLIHGDVTGTTLVTVNAIANGELGAVTSTAGAHQNHEGITLIQVSGNASPTAFKLNGDYVAVGGKPWQYRLYAYGPHPTEAGQVHPDAIDRAHPDQRLVAETTPGVKDDHWGFRLQNSAAPGQAPDAVPQVANYVLAPTGLFVAGHEDMGTLHRRLGEIRADDDHKVGELFLRGYGANGKQLNYRADRTADGRAYDASIRYAAMQAGGSRVVGQGEGSRMRLGLALSAGTLALTPKDVASSQKNTLKTVGISPYFTWQGANGAYVDAIALVGRFHGDVTTKQRGRTTRLKGTRQGVSVEAGIPVNIPAAGGLTVTPQVQVTYQRLKFNKTRDVDGFPVDVGSPRQVSVRAGATVQKQFQAADSADNPVRVYGKFHLVKHYDKGQAVWLGDRFASGKSGANLEAGLGVNARFAKGSAVAYAEVNRQQRIGSHGNQGWKFSLGVKVPF